MTSTTAVEVARRGRPRKDPFPFVTMAGHLAHELEHDAELVVNVRAIEEWTWPSERYRDRPVEFCREVLQWRNPRTGQLEALEPWDEQIKILEAVRDHKRVAVASGHKVAKSTTCAILGLWFYCSFDDARVVMTSTTAHQVDRILWRETRKLFARARHPIDGDLAQLARSGLKADDFREIVGFTAREAEAVAGISGANLLYLIDEASGVGDEIFEAIEGNRAAGARAALFGNPTRNEGEFFEAFHGKREFYFTMRISSESTPNVVEGREVIPGLASKEWIEEKKREWGEDSPHYLIRVKGEHALNEDGKIISAGLIAEAEARWKGTAAVGRLYVGFDPAGAGEGGDESVWCPRRGPKILEFRAKRGLNELQLLTHTLDLLLQYRYESEVPVLLIDIEGEIGWKVYKEFRRHAEKNPGDFLLVPIRSSAKAVRNPLIYATIRDELFACLADWLRESGALPEDVKLPAELGAFEWSKERTTRGRLKLTEKKLVKKLLGRSPDRADAAQLSTWEPASVREAEDDGGGNAGGGDKSNEPIDPFESDAMTDTGINPYGS